MALPPIKLTFTKLGPIEKATLDLRPLTVVVGANNTGKTYLAYAAAAVVRAQHAADATRKIMRSAPVRLMAVDADKLTRSFWASSPSMFSKGASVRGAFGAAPAPKPFVLPAERAALMQTYKVLAYRRVRMMRDELATPVAHAVFFQTPVEEFLDFLAEVELGFAPKRANAFGPLAAVVEAQLQGGSRVAFRDLDGRGRLLQVALPDDRRIDLHNASSSIKQLAPLVLYLRYRAAEGDLLIIDEPEMNLHPEGQARLLEVLAILASLGVYVLVTTHSPYLLAHLNNLIASTTKSPAVKKRQAESLYLGDRRAFLPGDQVSAYEMRDGTLHDLHDKDFGIRWDTLSDVSVELQQRYFAIREAETSPRGRAKKA